MSDLELLQKKVRKLQSRAGAAKMELHDLAAHLPVNWTEIEAVAWNAFEVFAELDAAKEELAALENSQ
ncbi:MULTISPECIES: CCE_0567 family metalloprotein [Mesorhizobium]|uniref:CCE_0567 family metalloprotein n=1 Tax=Mesorhizobium TaxID=68287 RepID=UPI0010A96137|nr:MULTISPECIES: CCE_0567 family metalloprotein [Mesorhizobium]